MQAVVIEINKVDAYVALPDGTNLNISTTHLPANIKAGERVHLSPGNSMITNPSINELL